MTLPDVILDNISDVLDVNTRIIVALGFGLAITIIIPIIALIYLCCCCCSSRPQTSKKASGVTAAIYGFFLFCCLLIASLGCIWFFVGNSGTQQGITTLPQVIDDISHDGDLFLNNTKEEISYLMEQNFGEAMANFNLSLDDVIKNFKTKIADIKVAINLTSINTAADGFANIAKGFNKITESVSTVQESTETLKKNIETTCESAPPVCLESFDVILKFLTDVIKPLSKIAGNGLDSTVMDNVDDISNQISKVSTSLDDLLQDFENEYFSDIQAQIDAVKIQLDQQKDEIINGISEMGNIFGGKQDLQDTISEYLKYFDYFVIAMKAIGSIIVIILAVMVLALTVSCCGKPGNKLGQTSAKIFRTSIGVFFSLGFFFFLITVVFFAVGALSTRFVCQTIKDPEHSDIIRLIDPAFINEIKKIYDEFTDETVTLNTSIVDLINGIQAGKPVYSLLQLKYIYDIEALESNWKEEFNINSVIDSANSSIATAIENVLKEKDKIDDIKSAILDPIDDVDSLLNAGHINDILKLQAPDFPDISVIDIGKIKTAYEELKGNIEGLKTSINETFVKYEISGVYTFNLKGDAEEVIKLVLNIFVYFEAGGSDTIFKFFTDSIDVLLGVIDVYLGFAVEKFTGCVGSLAPIGLIYHQLEVSLCDGIIDPFNTVWSGLGWTCLLILIPISILVKLLRNIYEPDLIRKNEFGDMIVMNGKESRSSPGPDGLKHKNMPDVGKKLNNLMNKYQKSSQPTQDKIPKSQPNYKPSAPKSQPNYQPSAPRSQPNYPPAPRSQLTTFPNMYEENNPRQVPSSQTKGWFETSKQREVPLKYQGEAKPLKRDGKYVIPDKYKGQGV
ncbi:prominin-1 isoform X3 [Eurytemora carolleeae]|nr:prominin-1 isoform X3 [Eurytemora carolleeae]|eukprot:XP_023346584.1 prominin-1-like isoform X3 [Eurytemora affinis]